MGNSTTTLQKIVDDALANGDLAPALATGGFADAPALSIANNVMQAMVNGGPNGQVFNWKWNRFNVVPNPLGILANVGGFGSFLTNSWQQDYAVPGLNSLAWIEHAFAININQTAQPKQVIRLEAKRDLEKNYFQTGNPIKISWLPNNQLDYGIWGQTSQNSATGLTNPGPNVVYTVPLGAGVAPSNPINQVVDPFGNFWVLTTYGTCGSMAPTWLSSPNYPTPANPSIVADTVTDGTCVWTAVNPTGQGFRLDPLPPQTGVVWLVRAVGQMKPVQFTSLNQTLEPIPDDHVPYFQAGFFAQCYQRNPDPKVRARFSQEWTLWLQNLDNAVRAGNREQDDSGFFPGAQIMSSGYAIWPGPAYPFAWPGPGGY